MFANGPGDRGSIPGRVIPKTQKMVLDAALLSTQHNKVSTKGKVEQSWEWSRAFPHLGAIEKGVFGSLSTKGRQLILLERRRKSDLLETFKILNRISNYGRHFFQYFSSNCKFLIMGDIFFNISPRTVNSSKDDSSFFFCLLSNIFFERIIGSYKKNQQ